jgi:hypothetical protein
MECDELGQQRRLGGLVVVLKKLDRVDRGEGEQRLGRPYCRLIALLDSVELSLEDRYKEVAVRLQPVTW